MKNVMNVALFVVSVSLMVAAFYAVHLQKDLDALQAQMVFECGEDK